VYHRDVARQPGRKSGVGWLDASDLSPFCGVRSDETLDVLSHVLIPVDVRTAAALTVPLLRMRPADAGEAAPPPAWKIRWALLKRRLGLQRSDVLDPRFVAELVVVGDAASDAGLILPGVAFATYRKRG
jgi:hypothetical protein